MSAVIKSSNQNLANTDQFFSSENLSGKNSNRTPRSSTHKTSGHTLMAFELANIACKKLVLGLQSWASKNVSDDGVSDLYTEFIAATNQVCECAQDSSISVVYVLEITASVKRLLEVILAEEPSFDVLERYQSDLDSLVEQYNSTLNDLKETFAAYGNLNRFNSKSGSKLLTLDTAVSASATANNPNTASSVITGLSTAVTLVSPSSALNKTEEESDSFNIDNVYLQFNEVVKKVSIQGHMSFQTLQMLFMEKFKYSPGQGEFPAIMIRNVGSDVFYLLENVKYVEENCVLKMSTDRDDNKEILESIQNGFSSMAKELKELKKLMTENSAKTVVATPTKPKRTDTIKRATTKSSISLAEQDNVARNAKLVGLSDEVAEARRSLAVIRQMQQNIMDSVKEKIVELKSTVGLFKNTNHQQLNPARSELNTEKQKMKQKVEMINEQLQGLQYCIEEMKTDVTQRRCMPSEAKMAFVISESSALESKLSEVREFHSLVKPKWKRTWEAELSSIVDEQQFVKEQALAIEEFSEDHAAIVDVIRSIQQIIDLQKKAPLQVKQFIPQSPDENFDGLKSVLQEISAVGVDSTKRLEAIQRAEKIRRKEMDYNLNPFEKELKDFVGLNRLQPTGGVQEVERMREKKMKQMFVVPE